MSFRSLLYLCLTLAVLTGTVFEAVSDYLEGQGQVSGEIAAAFEEVETLALASISVEGGPPRLPGVRPAPPPGGRFRVLRGSRVILAVDGLAPGAEAQVRQRPLSGDYTLEVAVDARLPRDRVRREFYKDLTDDALQVVLSVVVAALLARSLLRPLRTLERAVNELSVQRFPEPIPVPPGNDELSQLARGFNRMSSNMQAALDRERFFTRYASHELRTPLSALKLQLEALELGLHSADEVIPALERNVDRMQRVLEALLSLARASEHLLEPLPFAGLVNDTLHLLPEEARARVQVSVTLAPDRPVAQPYLIGQCVLNLVDNALKYTPGDVRVTVEAAAPGVRVRVEDRGGGVPEELLDKLTHSFFRVSKHVPGSGLGLAFVKHIARTVGGDLTLRNTDGGLEAMLEVPAVPGG